MKFGFGKSYDNFINVVNMSITNLNQIFQFTVSDIPWEIAAKALKYAQADQGTASASFVEQTVLTLSNLPKTNRDQLRFRTDGVEVCQGEIVSKFVDAKDEAEDAKETAENLSNVWQSLSGEVNISELKKAFRNLSTILNDLSDSLRDIIDAQLDNINKAESVINFVEAAGDVKDDAINFVADAAQEVENFVKETWDQTWKDLLGKN